MVKICESTDDFRLGNYHEVQQVKFAEAASNYEIKIRGTLQDMMLFERLRNGNKTIGEIAELPRGMEFGANSELVISHPKQGFGPLFVGRDIKKYSMTFSERYVKHQRSDEATFKSLRYYQSEKILIQRIRNLSLHDRIVATYDKSGAFCTNTLRMLILRSECKRQYPLRAVLALLNSKLINHLFLTLFLNKDIYAYQL